MMAIALIAVTLIFTLGLAMSNADADATVYRGSAVETVSTTHTSPVILRGSPGLRTRVAKAAPQPRATRIAAGETLWLVDNDGETITACSLRSSGYAGRRKLVCTTHR